MKAGKKQATPDDKNRIDRLFKSYHRLLCFYAEGMVGKESAEDVVSDVFLMLLEKKESIRIHQSLKAYLYKCVRNKSLNYMKHIQVLRQYVKDVNDRLSPNQRADGNDPLSILISMQMVSDIELAIDSLPLKCKEIFLLAKFEGLTYTEIAEKLNISLNTVRKQITVATGKMCEALGENRKMKKNTGKN